MTLAELQPLLQRVYDLRGPVRGPDFVEKDGEKVVWRVKPPEGQNWVWDTHVLLPPLVPTDELGWADKAAIMYALLADAHGRGWWFNIMSGPEEAKVHIGLVADNRFFGKATAPTLLEAILGAWIEARAVTEGP